MLYAWHARAVDCYCYFVDSQAFFKIELNVFSGYFIPTHFFNNIKITNYRGDLTDISCKTVYCSSRQLAAAWWHFPVRTSHPRNNVWEHQHDNAPKWKRVKKARERSTNTTTHQKDNARTHQRQASKGYWSSWYHNLLTKTIEVGLEPYTMQRR